MDFGKAFSYVFEDQDWLKKVGLGGLIAIVPVLNFAVAGYGVEVLRRVVNNDPKPLPEWDDLGGKLVKGLIVTVIQFIYMIPIWLVSCAMQVAVTAVGGVSQSGSSSSGDTMGAAMVAITSCFSCLMLIYGVFVGVILPAVIGNYAIKDQFGAAFRFGEVFGLVQKNLGLYVMVYLISIVAGLVAGLGVIACFIGVLFTGFYAMLVIYHAYGQAYREASANIGLV